MFAEESPEWNVELGGSVTCESCNDEPATVHLLKVVDGRVKHTHLCAACAENMARQTEGLALVLAVPSMLWGRDRSGSAEEKNGDFSGDNALRFCAACGTTLSDLRESGLVGCPKCYQVFAAELENFVRNDEELGGYVGKIPRRGPESEAIHHEMMRLERMLKELVACERYEEAAGVRDRLVELEQLLGSESK